MRYLGLTVLAACGSPAPASPAPPVDGAALVAQMFKTYGSLKIYSDHGEVVRQSDAGASSKIQFETYFVRDQRFRFSFAADKNHYELWSDGTHSYLKASFLDRIIDFGPKLVEAFEARIAPSIASDVPELLFASTFALDKLRVEPEAGRDWHVVGIDKLGDRVDLWIDRNAHVLHRLKRAHFFEATASRPVASHVTTTTTFDATVEQPIADSALAQPVLDRPIDTDEPPSWIGILTDPSSNVVKQVVPGAPAEKAGLKAGDEVVSIDGHPVANGKEVVETAHQLHAQHPAPIVVKRNGAEVPLMVTPEPRPDALAVQAKFIGKPAPSFGVTSIDNKPIDQSTFANHVVVLDFWATWCGPCAITTPHLEDLAKRHPELRVVGISDEDRDDVVKFLAKHPPSYTQALDAGDHATRDYLIQGLPTIYVIDKAGIVRYTAVGVPDFTELDAQIAKLL